MAIMKPQELTKQQDAVRIRMIVAGHPGIGKSTFALSAPKPLLIDADLGLTRVNAAHRKDYIRVGTYEELLNDLFSEGVRTYETIIIDTGQELLNLMKFHVIKANPKNGQTDGTLSLKGYGAVGQEFQRLVSRIYYELKKHLIIVFHAKEEKDGDNTILRIMVEGQTKNNIWQPMELGGFIEMRGNDRYISFENNERHYGKATHGVCGALKIPSLGSYDQDRKWIATGENDFLTKLFEQINENIRTEAGAYEQDREKYEKLMADWTAEIETMTPDRFNDVASAIKQTKHILTSEKELIALFTQRMHALGYKYDRKAGEYVSLDRDAA